jgi:ABC-type transport system involved in multi-copper enzyme maturation permease subunit
MWTTLIGKEFASRLQGKLSYVILTLLVAVFTALALASFWMVVLSVPTIVPVIGSSVGSSPSVTIQSLVASNRGVFLFYSLAVCLLAAVFSVAPAVASSAISSERENDTFDLLLIGGLRARSIVIGKLIAAVLFVLLLASTALPGFAIAWMFGGVSARDVGLVLLMLLATLAFISAVGLLFSALARTSTLAALYTYAVVYLLALGSLLGYLLGASAQNESMVRPLLSLNPFVTLLTVPEGITSSLQQTLPFQYRASLDLASHDWLGLPLRYPRWLNTVGLYLLGTIVLALATGLAIDPCHRWRSRVADPASRPGADQ